MTDLDSILDALAGALELERELGVRAVEIDRALLAGQATAPAAPAAPAASRLATPAAPAASRLATPVSRPETQDEDARREAGDARSHEDARREAGDARSHEDARRETRDAAAPLPVVFLHDRALSAGGVEMMAKIVTAMHQTPETAPVLFMGTRPAARVTVVLGLRALRHWFPGAAGAPGQWIAPDGVPNVLVTYSPEYILRFGAQTPAVKKLKMDMWTSLKGALQRIG